MRRVVLLALLLPVALLAFFVLEAHATYHPTLGRFLQRDPAEYKDGMSLHQYVGSNPVANHDSEGTELRGHPNLKYLFAAYGVSPKQGQEWKTTSFGKDDVVFTSENDMNYDPAWRESEIIYKMIKGKRKLWVEGDRLDLQWNNLLKHLGSRVNTVTSASSLRSRFGFAKGNLAYWSPAENVWKAQPIGHGGAATGTDMFLGIADIWANPLQVSIVTGQPQSVYSINCFYGALFSTLRGIALAEGASALDVLGGKVSSANMSRLIREENVELASHALGGKQMLVHDPNELIPGDWITINNVRRAPRLESGINAIYAGNGRFYVHGAQDKTTGMPISQTYEDLIALINNPRDRGGWAGEAEPNAVHRSPKMGLREDRW